ncbi:MAG: prolyl oligopeptidase family serine peptidase [Bacteroidaceae bacterium]|nr:prolyl oligopeptidase family serine peptidase [Bacteroidaceae bacterium]
MKRFTLKSLLSLALLIAGVVTADAAGETKQYLTFKTESYCAATWEASTNTFTWGLGGSNSDWTFMAADGISGDLSGWTRLHLHVSDFKNASARQLRIVFKKNDGSYPPNGPTKEFVVSPDASGDIDIQLTDVKWGNCDIKNIQDLTIYGCARDDKSKNASVKVTDAYYISQGGTINQTAEIIVNGETRSYRLYVPKGCQPGAPLVVAMHGASGSMNDQSPHFNEIADTAKFIIAYPQGKMIYFPVFGGTVTGWDASGEDNADAAFLRAIVDNLAEEYQIDRKRVYCCGFSNGGMNTYAMSNACSDVFAAFAAISGFPLNEFHLRHVGKRPVPFLHIHGKNDDFVRYKLMPTIVDEMVARMGANPVPVKKTVKGKYDKSVYQATEGSFPYIYYEIDGMGHNDFTSNTEDGNSSLTMWRFFRQYTLDTPCDTTLKWMPRIETEGFTPKEHGWTVNLGKTLLAFGQGAKTDANQNVYPSLQFTNGRYKLCFKSQGEAGKTITVRLQQIQPSKVVFTTNVAVGEDATIYFSIKNSDFGQYKLTFIRENTTDDISISNICIFSLKEGEAASIGNVTYSQSTDNKYYTLGGFQTDLPVNGIYIQNGRKVFVR